MGKCETRTKEISDERKRMQRKIRQQMSKNSFICPQGLKTEGKNAKCFSPKFKSCSNKLQVSIFISRVLPFTREQNRIHGSSAFRVRCPEPSAHVVIVLFYFCSNTRSDTYSGTKCICISACVCVLCPDLLGLCSCHSNNAADALSDGLL